MKHKYFIDTNKGVTFIVILGMMAFYNQWQNPTAWVYLALHGTYGLLWVMKSSMFPDASWERKISVWFGLVSWVSLVLYWIPGWLLMWKGVTAPPWLLGIAVSMNAFGIFFVFAGDMQKFTSLKLHPGELITDSLFKLSRNINYFGEFLIYAAFALLPMMWFAFLPLVVFILAYWIPNMIRKDKSLAALPGFQAYKKNTRSFFPFLF
jgi:steroid 5-alpha reductase family enzyme